MPTPPKKTNRKKTGLIVPPANPKRRRRDLEPPKAAPRPARKSPPQKPAPVDEKPQTFPQHSAPITPELLALRAITDRAARVEQVVKWIVEGNDSREIADTIAAAWPEEHGERLEVDALQAVVQAGQIEGDLVKGWLVLAYKAIFAKTFALGDFGCAMNALRQLGTIFDQT